MEPKAEGGALPDSLSSLKDFGALGDGITDDTAAVQAAVDASVGSGTMLFCPAGTYKLSAPINVGGVLSMIGEGCSVDRGASAPGPGTWFYLAHSGVGFFLVTTRQGGMFQHFGTYRSHAAPGVGWAPTVYDYDIQMSPAANEWTFRDLMLLSPYKGIKCSNRPTIDNVKMHPFMEGICIDDCRDTARLQNVHMWPFWSEDASVTAFTLANLKAYRFLRCDNPTMVGCFSIYHDKGVSIENGATGSTYAFRMSCSNFDSGVSGIVIDAAVSGATLYLSDVVTQNAYTFTTVGIGLHVAGSNCAVTATGFYALDHGQGLIRVDGENNTVIVCSADFRNWDRTNAGFPAVFCAPGNYCAVWDYQLVNSFNTTSPRFSGPVKTKHNHLVYAQPGDVQADFIHAGEAVIMAASHYLYLPASLPVGTSIVVMNLAGSGGNAYVAPVSGVSLHKAGTPGNVAVVPGGAVSLVKAGASAWIAL